MNTEVIDTHSIIPNLLKPEGIVLDVGCRGFVFAREMSRRGLHVIALDPDASIIAPEDSKLIFEAKALIHGSRRRAVYASWSTGEGNHLCVDRAVPHYADSSQVPCVNLQYLMKKYCVQFFEVVKMDCEGSEYDILLNWPGPIARQITVEFHDFAGFNPFPNVEDYYELLVGHLGQWYEVVRHENYPHPLAPAHPVNYWDSLFVLRGCSGL